jgi:hypothetical protein
VNIWRGAGFTYTEEQAGTVFQVLVRFGALTFAGQGSGSAVRSGHDEDPRGAVYSYPADKVFRIDSGGVKVNGAEVESINASLERDWIFSHIEAVPVGLPCKGEGSCAGQTLQVLILITWFYCRWPVDGSSLPIIYCSCRGSWISPKWFTLEVGFEPAKDLCFYQWITVKLNSESWLIFQVIVICVLHSMRK